MVIDCDEFCCVGAEVLPVANFATHFPDSSYLFMVVVVMLVVLVIVSKLRYLSSNQRSFRAPLKQIINFK